MYGNPPDAVEWDGIEPEDTGLFDDVLEETEEGPPRKLGWMPSGFVEWFALGQTLLPALLFLPGSQAYRLPIRTGAYAVSLFAFGLWWFGRGGRRRGKHPATGWISLMMVWLALMMFHPDTGPIVGVAQIALYVAILCPVFWAGSYVFNRQRLMRALVVLLACNGVNSIVGVMQVYDPERWLPRQLSGVYLGQGGEMMLASSTFVGLNGRVMVRPPGLFDAAGAVAGAAMVATILGLVFCLEPIAWWKRGVSLGFSLAGMSALYLSNVRAAFVMTLGMMVAYLALLVMQNQRKRVIGFGVLGFGMVLIGFSIATSLGGDSIADRFR